MDLEKGIAYCGLACCLCSENADCPGCRQEGCANKDWCKSFHCCKEKHLPGCWACGELETCDNFMLKKPKIHAFAAYIAKYGAEALLGHLARNAEHGVVYHDPGSLIGDYDRAETQEAIWDLLEHGKPEKD